VYVKDKFGHTSEVKTVSLKISNPAGNYVLNTLKPSGLNTTLEGGLYRFQGTSANNYICFGTSTKSTCTGNTDAYMYRIIGINSSGQLKLIKKEALNSTVIWYENTKSNVPWPNSAIFSNLNENSFLNNTMYIPSTTWSEKIAITTWKYGDNTINNTTAASLYSIENAWSSTVNAKIGLMYAHDYYYAYQSGGLNCSESASYSTCAMSWMHLWNFGNDSTAPSNEFEWTMSHRSPYNGNYFGWFVHSSGKVSTSYFTTPLSARPVFFLNSDVQYLSGSGTLADPIIIS